MVTAIRSDGHDAVYAAELHAAAPDAEILRIAASDGRILVTEDKDFGRLLAERTPAPPAVILLRFGEADVAGKIARLRSLFAAHADELPGRLVVVGSNRLRFRRL